jgi:IS5 family transposase
MRKRFDAQISLGDTPIERVIIPLNSRDELPPVLAGLQWIFKTPELNAEIFELLEQKVVGDKQDTGRPGMDLWHIFVLGTVRLCLDCDYDRLEHIANHDGLVRQLMGLQRFGGEQSFHHKTISGNVCQIDADMLEQINTIVVRHGRSVFKKSAEAEEQRLEVKTDSYVLESNVHHPTDCNLLWDAARKCVELLSQLHEKLDVPGWRKGKLWKRQLKTAKRGCERAASGGGANKDQRVRKTTEDYLEKARGLDQKVSQCVEQLKARPLSVLDFQSLTRIGYFHDMLIKHIDLTDRRLLQKETIPHAEKIFSLFEPHTELIKKGKTRPPVEFGHRLLLSTDENDLVVDYKVMEGGSESGEIVGVADRLLNRFGEDAIASLSTDKGFSSEDNRELLELYIDEVVMPKKGRKNAAERERESTKVWIKLRNRHSAVESNINSLEHHGLDRCPDKGLHGYKRYAGLGILAYNLHKIGDELLAKAAAVERRKRKKKKAA